MDAHHPEAGRHGSRRAALGLAAVVAIVAVAGLTISLLQPRTAAVPEPTGIPPGSTSEFAGPLTGLGFSVADDQSSHQVVVFGGIDSADTTWLWDGERWSAANPQTTPSGRSGAAAAYDPMSQLVMLFGGSLASGKSADDTWAWDGTTWLQLKSDATRPPPGAGALMAWDNATLQMVLVTEAEKGTGAETWTWNVSGWARQPHGDLSVSVSGAVMADEPTGEALLLATPVSPENGIGLTLQWTGSTWRLLDSDGPELEGMAADPQRDVLIACGTATYSAATTVQASCWEWATTTWRRLDEAAAPPDSRQVIIEMEVDDVDDARLLMFGWLNRAIPGQPQPLRIWWWDDGGWTLLA